MHFTRLRLQGFKSFVEPTDLDIAEGLTGIVGPNGCGKSNLVEALRWVMGESSAKRMRGADMDDVIFAGTATRPSRNLAEVSLQLDNAESTAPAEFNNDKLLNVARVIERGSGSDYRVNGRPVRQKDVQLLFADQATGAHSTNLVGQGQIDALIRAKPQDRRQILEEASGTAGLQARRHEAELKLKGAEQNLTRVDDVLAAHDAQLRSLKQQVRQASRYRNLAEHIRRTEAALLHLRWAEAERNAENLRQALAEAEARAGELLAVVTAGTARRTDIAADLPGLRQAEAAAAAIVQKLHIRREQIEAEARRLAEETRSNEQRLAQAQNDREREEARRRDGEAAIARHRDDIAQVDTAASDIAARLPAASQALATVTQETDTLDAEVTRLTHTAAATEARLTSLQGELGALARQRADLTAKREKLDAERASLAAEVADRPDLALAASLVAATETELARRESQAQSAEQYYREAEKLQIQARDIVQEAQARVMRLRAEAEALDSMLRHHDDRADQVIDLIAVTPGLENALAVALGETLTAALDPAAAMHWRDLPPLDNAPALPAGVEALADHIKAPTALARSLSQVGLVTDAAAGESAAAQLHPGQIIVSRDGWAWRWDGFTMTPDAKTATALRLQQRNRRAALDAEIAQAEGEAQSAEAALAEASSAFGQRKTEDQDARAALKAAFAALADARAAHAAQEKESTAAMSKLAALDESLRQTGEALEGVRARAASAENELRTLPDIEAQRADIAERRAALAEKRGLLARCQSECDHLSREKKSCEARRAAAAQDMAAWQERLAAAAQHASSLAERIAEIEARLSEIRARPAELDAARADVLSQLEEAEAARRQASDRLIETERALEEAERQLKQDEAALGNAREERVRAEAALQAAQDHFAVLRERMAEKLNCGPEELLVLAAGRETEAPDMAELEQALARYLRERDAMGPVNLRAETEAETLQGEIDRLQREKDDLVAAIAKLRQGISQLNREARDRLQGAFGLVNERFQKLFARLFEGGRAYLELIDNEDPMNAGLEIFASPPGKKMQVLSLLSGGERTLTALALLFAVFQTNPSPICVLDEAEAALDEGNIDRFCALVEDIARETGTRFLIITHHRLTMARMDRLYGVTMSEKGVSQLVSVDLAGAVAIRDGETPDLSSGAENSGEDGKNDAASAAEAALADVRAA